MPAHSTMDPFSRGEVRFAALHEEEEGWPFLQARRLAEHKPGVTWGSWMPKHGGHLKTQARETELLLGNKAASITTVWPPPHQQVWGFSPHVTKQSCSVPVVSTAFPKEKPTQPVNSPGQLPLLGALGRLTGSPQPHNRHLVTLMGLVQHPSLSAAAWGSCTLKLKHT